MFDLLLKLDSFFKKLATNTGLFGGWSLILYAVILTINGITRKFFNYSIPGLSQFGGYSLAIFVALSFSVAQYGKAHIRVNLIVDKLSLKYKAYFNILALLTFFITVLLLVYACHELAYESWELKSKASDVIRVSLFYPQGIWVLIMWVFVLVLFIRLGLALLELVRGDYKSINRLIGTEEIEKELAMDIQDIEHQRHKLANKP